jgi:hypothetical protein
VRVFQKLGYRIVRESINAITMGRVADQRFSEIRSLVADILRGPQTFSTEVGASLLVAE